MNYYHESIIKATGCLESDAPIIEDIMRHVIFHSTLSWQTREVFDKGARDAYDVHLYELGIDNPDKLKAFAKIMTLSIIGKDTEKLIDEIVGNNVLWSAWGKYVRANKLTVKEIKC